jgi:diguanylate cyclase (GGDEF)-like protein
MMPTVLVIDDSPEVLAVVAARLRPEGYRVITAADWESGMDLAFVQSPDLILLDVNMPDVSGLDVCRRLKADPRTGDIPVIFLTASDDVSVKVHSFDLGATDYVTKPFHPAELRARVRAALRTKREHDTLGTQARQDSLTGLWNRGQFDRILESEVAIAIRESKPLSLVMVDLDHFKRLNDGYGHVFGDAVLRGVSTLLSEGIRGTDYACRYGGEELALVLSDTTGEAAVEVCERLRERLVSHEFSVKDGAPVTITASFGIAEIAQKVGAGVVTASGLVDAADEALYSAKREGRDRVVFHPRGRRVELQLTRLRAS